MGMFVGENNGNDGFTTHSLEEEDSFYDSVGGYHSNGIGWSPTGIKCGRCSEVTCEDCQYNN